jgi:hypothetical protein
MLIWILAVVLFGITGACGYKLGAVRFAVSLVGLILGAALAIPLGPYVKSVVPMLGFKNPIWMVVLPPVLVFLLIYAIFVGVSFLVHQRVELHFKYHAGDDATFGWSRVNNAIGLWVGLAMGATWLFLFGVVIYVAGYLTVQVTTDETSSTGVRMLSQARNDLHTTGVDRAVAKFDPMPPKFYAACDILGLIYQNPILISRVSQYPPFLLLTEKPEFQEMTKDAEFMQMLLSKADALAILQHPKMQAVMQNPEIVQQLLDQDLPDLRAYLETGISPKYEDERILGKWRLDPYATMAQERKRKPDMTSTEMRRLKMVMTEIMPAVMITATTDKKVVVKAEGVGEKLNQLFNPPAPKPVEGQAAAPTQALSPQLAQRYGQRGGGARAAGPAPTPVPAAAPPKPVEIPYAVLSSQGVWERDPDGKYQLKLQDEKGKSQTFKAVADDERLSVTGPTAVLVFAKAE